MTMRLPFLRPNPPRLSSLRSELAGIEESGWFSNYGPVNTKFENAATEQLFNGIGGCLTVNNATTGLILAIREAMGETPASGGRYALMPSFTFAATAHAAIWAGLTPLFCDIDQDTWLPCPGAEAELLSRYAHEIAVVIPYATFGNCLNLRHYEDLAKRNGVGIVVDAAASLGSLDADNRGFGAGFGHAVIYSMHVTKAFSTGEAGLIHCADAARLDRLRAMGNFGFSVPTVATMPGLNAKLSEVGALLALSELDRFESAIVHRETLADAYQSGLPTGWQTQRIVGRRCAYQFMPALLPEAFGPDRDHVLAHLAARGIGARHYFSPHLAEQPYFSRICVAGALPVTERIARLVMSLPMSDTMSLKDVDLVCSVLAEATGSAR